MIKLTIWRSLILVGLVFLAGCQTRRGPGPALATKPPPCGPCGESGMNKIDYYLPGNHKDQSPVLVERAAPEQVRVGEVFEYHIKVTNRTKADLLDFALWDRTDPNFKLHEASPEPTEMKEDFIAWQMGRLMPGEARLVKVKGVATGACTLKPMAEVAYRTEPVCLPIEVVQPSLMLTKTAASEVLICDPIPMRFVVKNVGTGQACNVVIHDDLPEGLRTMDNKKELMFVAGTLNAGESREFMAQVTAAKTGTYSSSAIVTADDGLQAETPSISTLVVKPELSVSMSYPSTRYIGRPIDYEITVLNGPEAIAEDTILTARIPPGATFISASEGGNVSSGQVVWNLGTVPPRGCRKVQLRLKADATCDVESLASVAASCGTAEASAVTAVKGIPAIMLECVDVDDPVEVGATTTYQITVTNQGSAVGTNIAVHCMLPQAMEYVSSAGPTDASIKDNVITFFPLDLLAPKDKAVYHVTAKALRPCDCRFEVTLNSDQMTAPAKESEATHLYE